MLLHRFPNIGRVYVTVRARSQEESETRFWNNVITAPPFDPLRERYGSALEGFHSRQGVVEAATSAKPTSVSPKKKHRHRRRHRRHHQQRRQRHFQPHARERAAHERRRHAERHRFRARMKRPALVHVSTCFVAGNRSGAVWESDPVLGYFPRKDEMPGVEFSVEQEIATAPNSPSAS
jgi:long-chain acyl-CoA synthetase